MSPYFSESFRMHAPLRLSVVAARSTVATGDMARLAFSSAVRRLAYPLHCMLSTSLTACRRAGSLQKKLLPPLFCPLLCSSSPPLSRHSALSDLLLHIPASRAADPSVCARGYSLPPLSTFPPLVFLLHLSTSSPSFSFSTTPILLPSPPDILVSLVLGFLSPSLPIYPLISHAAPSLQ